MEKQTINFWRRCCFVEMDNRFFYILGFPTPLCVEKIEYLCYNNPKDSWVRGIFPGPQVHPDSGSSWNWMWGERN